jgi:hypothetical protein
MIKGGLLLLLALSLEGPSVESLYGPARKYDKETFRFRPPSGERVDRMRALSRSLTADALAGRKRPGAKERAKARALGLDLIEGQDAGGRLWILREAGARRSGDGYFAWRPGGSVLCVQAPHSFFDEGTGEIALALFSETRALALFVNTVHRYSPVVAGAVEDAADVAHATPSLFQAATEGLLAARLSPVVQVHGFGPTEHLPSDTAAVVSDGGPSRPSDAPAVRLRKALQDRMGARVLLYGVDAQELGATTNAQGRIVRAAGAIFLHIEMSQRVRSAGAAAASQLASALLEALPRTN